MEVKEKFNISWKTAAFVALGWVIFSTLNFSIRYYYGVSSLEMEALNLLLLVTLATSYSLATLFFIHYFSLLRLGFSQLALLLIPIAMVAGGLLTLTTLFGVALYYLIVGYASEMVIFFAEFVPNWLVSAILMYLWSIFYVAWKIYLRWHVEKKKNEAMTVALQTAEVQNLNSQLNPHLLFNSLNNIRSLMLVDVDKARTMLTHLSDILRYSLVSHGQLTSLSEEFAMVKSYLELVSIQYEERLQVDIEYDPTLDTCKIPPLVLQMLIENAIKHGIDKLEEGGQLKINITPLNESHFRIEISNPGTLNLTETNHNEKNSARIGLVNIQDRLKILYDGDASFTIEQENNNVVATVTLPR